MASTSELNVAHLKAHPACRFCSKSIPTVRHLLMVSNMDIGEGVPIVRLGNGGVAFFQTR